MGWGGVGWEKSIAPDAQTDTKMVQTSIVKQSCCNKAFYNARHWHENCIQESPLLRHLATMGRGKQMGQSHMILKLFLY